MARLPTPYVCDYCGAQKRETNHWWLLRRYTSDGQEVFELASWNEHAAAAAEGVEHICGQECAQKALAKYMASVDSANAGKPQPADESQEERQ
jgi:hypothetical protein